MSGEVGRTDGRASNVASSKEERDDSEGAAEEGGVLDARDVGEVGALGGGHITLSGS